MNSLPKTVTRRRRSCDLNRGPSAPESSTLTTRLPSHPLHLTAPNFVAVNATFEYEFIRFFRVRFTVFVSETRALNRTRLVA